MNGARVPAARWVLRGLLLFALAFTNLNDIWSPDVVPNTLFAWTLVREGDVDYDEFVFDPDPLALPPPGKMPRDSYFFRACGPTDPSIRIYTFGGSAADRAEFERRLGSPRSLGGPPPPFPGQRVCSVFPPGISLLALPILAPFVLADVSPADGGALIRAGHLAAALIETLAALFLWATLRRVTTERWSLALVLLYWLGTSVRTISSQALWQHAGVHLAIALALWIVLHERVSIRRELIAGVVLGLGAVVRQTNAIVALGAARFPWPPIAMVRPLAAVALPIGALIGMVPLAVYGWLVFGSPLEQGYGEKPFDVLLPQGLYGLLLSPSRGLFIYEPWVIAALASLALAWRRTGLVALRFRGLSVAWLLTLTAYARYAEWWGGRVFGPRFLDDLAPVVILALGWGISQGLLARTWARVGFWVAAAWSLLLFNVAAFVYDPSKWDTVPLNVNFHPERLLDWTDPQWVAVLGSLGSADARVLAAVALSAVMIGLLLRLELRRVPRAAGG